MDPIPVFTDYGDIPLILQEYILTIARKSSILDIPIDDINGYFDTLQDSYQYRFIPDGELSELESK